MDLRSLEEPVQCPACGLDATRDLGPLAQRGGLFPEMPPGRLRSCAHCNLLFRHPCPPGHELIRRYNEVPASAWAATGGFRPDHREVRRALRVTVPSGTVLDLGCFRGDFLATLPGVYEPFGVELSASARDIARTRGIIVVGADLDDAVSRNVSPDAITLIDVLEHVTTPRAVLEKACRLLRPGGVIIVSTADADTWLWRRHRLDYWYYFSEHIVFLSLSWFRWIAAELHMDLLYVRRFSYFALSPWQRLVAAARTATHETALRAQKAPVLVRLAKHIYPLSRALRWQGPPWMAWVRDHIVITLRRRDA